MPILELSSAERSAHRSDAHALKPIVLIGADGLTPAVTKEVNNALKSHGLIKVRVFGDDRETRIAIYNQLCDELDAAPIQHIGKLLVLYRPKVEKEVADKRRGKQAGMLGQKL
jgi:putative YhbY family RNA-binding protein